MLLMAPMDVAKNKMKQDDLSLQAYYERRLLGEIANLTEQIKDLENQRYALQVQLQKAKAHKPELHAVNRKNSINRTLVEGKILDALAVSSKPLSNTTLFREGRMVDAKLKETTFRTYLHRMKQRGLIVSPNRGVWSLKEIGQS